MSEEIRRRFDERAPEYDRSDMHRELAEAVAAFIALDALPATTPDTDSHATSRPVSHATLRPASRAASGAATILDVGTGTALLLRALHRREPRLNLIGVDLSPGMLEVARAALPSAELMEGDAARLPVGEASADVVTCVTALHLFDDPAAAVGEWGRVLRPGGRVVTATFTAVDRSRHPSATADHHALFATPERLGALLRPIGRIPLRHEHWSHGDDTVLIAEFGPAPARSAT
ncbi:class I SAM-dependent methyltransferase [Leifsonia sp. AG29]|uniref:class I SAM-dependent methyltransferase n=1 Tax=Leifsonia sp. AG29 TaxID=2598860 RepID=UPI001E506B09|nr:class I SAM-dependent methyltransferase [Leifsonia sp. AG29]